MNATGRTKHKHSALNERNFVYSARVMLRIVSCLLLSIGFLTSCSRSEPSTGLPESCTESSSPYVDYAASQLREAVAFAFGYETYANTKGENSLWNNAIETNLRFANTSIQVWLAKNPECHKEDVALFASALAKLDSKPFRSKAVPSVKKLVESGYRASQALKLDITYAPIPGPDTNSGDIAVPRPADVVAQYKKYDDLYMRISIDASNSE
ncbi:MAG: hypothetical protein EBR84_02150 [Actinobacteria bacterium]|nr:hypothetical protein [Actinomycetota bacterium]